MKMKIFKKYKEYCYLIVFSVFILGFLGGYLISASRLSRIEQLLLSVQQDIGYSEKQEQQFPETGNNDTAPKGDTNQEYYTEADQACDDFLVASIIDGIFLEIKENDLIMAGQKENEGKEYRLALSPQTNFIKWTEERGAMEVESSLKELVDLKGRGDVVPVSVVALCSGNDTDNCQAKVVRIIPEN